MFPGSYLAPASVAALGAVRREYPIDVVVPAAADLSGSRPGMSAPSLKFNGGNFFFSEFYSISYPTAYNNGEADVDDGICRLFARLAIGTSDINLSAGYMFLNNIAIPGRIPSLTGAAGVFPGAAPGIPGKPCPALVTPGDAIYHNMQNFSNLIARTFWVWTGWDIPASKFASSEDVWAVIAEHQPIAPAVM